MNNPNNQPNLNPQVMFIPRMLKTPQLFLGKGSLVYLKHAPIQQAILITSKTATLTPAYAKAKEFLQGKIAAESICESAQETQVQNLAQLISQTPHDAIIAFGGGKVLDASKLAAFKAECKQEFTQLSMLSNYSRTSTFIAIPTTPATGSEANGVAVMLSTEGKKTPYSSPTLVPDTTILDSELLTTLPQEILFDSIGDIFAHCLEAYFSRFSNPLVKNLSKTAIETIAQNTPLLEQNPQDSNALNQIFSAGYLAGICAGNAFVGPIHALAHSAEELAKIPHAKGVLNITKNYLNWATTQQPNQPQTPSNPQNNQTQEELEWFNQKFAESGLEKHCSNQSFASIDLDQWLARALTDKFIKTGATKFTEQTLKEFLSCFKK